MKKIYVASSWKNTYQPMVVEELRRHGYEVYDFRADEGFSWREVDPTWESWNPYGYLAGLNHPSANRGFNRDMEALRDCDACVMVMPCGLSSGLELGFCRGRGIPTLVFVPELQERGADLMVKMADGVTHTFDEVPRMLGFLLKS